MLDSPEAKGLGEVRFLSLCEDSSSCERIRFTTDDPKPGCRLSIKFPAFSPEPVAGADAAAAVAPTRTGTPNPILPEPPRSTVLCDLRELRVEDAIALRGCCCSANCLPYAC